MGSDNALNDSAGRPALPLVDSFGRVHTSLRISVTDRCNIRCQYCMPAGDVQFLEQSRLLSFEQWDRLVRVFVRSGIRKVRITGGEPLLRPRLHELVARLSSVNELNDLALTTNGMLLASQVASLVAAGLKRVNISLDTLRESTFRDLSRRPGISQVLEGIEAALRYSQLSVRLNALVLRSINGDEIVPLADFARKCAVPLRFIEFMPLDADRRWNETQLVTGEEVRGTLEKHFGPLTPIPRSDASQPASDFRFADGVGTVGFIDSVTRPFCDQCNRLRVTAEGKLRNCLFGREEWELGSLLSSSSDDSQLEAIIRQSVIAKRRAHGIDQPDFRQPERAMFQIGG